MEIKYKHKYVMALSRKESKDGLIDIDIDRFIKYCEGSAIESQEDLESLLDEYIWDNYEDLTLPLNSNEEQDDLDTDTFEITNLKEVTKQLSYNIKILTCCEKNARYHNYKFCPDCGSKMIY